MVVEDRGIGPAAVTEPAERREEMFPV
jgi:hypothetical protein